MTDQTVQTTIRPGENPEEESPAAFAGGIAAEPERMSTGDDRRVGGGGTGPVQHGPIETALGVVRIGVGLALVAAPGWAGRIWVGPGADGPGSKVFARALGARDVALGVRILQGVQEGEPVDHWIAAGFAADLADTATSLLAARNLTPARRVLVPLVAGGVGAAGLASTRRARLGR